MCHRFIERSFHMLPKYSVKKPLTVLVAVVLVVVLGVVSYTRMTPSLLPNMEFPYIIIVTTYPGASPEQVEEEVTKPLEQEMATLDNVEEITSTSAENYSMVTIEFTDDVNMDSVTVDINSSLTQLIGSWDSAVGTPYTMKISPDMIPVSIAAVSMESADIAEMSDFVTNTLQNKLEGIDGVASVSTGGIVEETIQVTLSEEKIEALNEKAADAILAQFEEAEDELADAQEQLSDGLDEANDGLREIQDAKDELSYQHDLLAAQLASAETELDSSEQEILETKLTLVDTIADLTAQMEELETTLSLMRQLKTAVDSIQAQRDELEEEYISLSALYTTYTALTAEGDELALTLEAIEHDTTLTDEQKQAATEEFTSSDEYLQNQSSLATVEAQMSALGLDGYTIEAAVYAAKSALDLADTSIEGLDSLLQELGTSFETLDNDIALIEDGIVQIEAGIDTLYDTIDQLEDGSVTISEAKTELATQQSSAEYQMATAAAELSVTEAAVSSTITQLEASQAEIESAIDELEETKQETLEQADVTSIVTMSAVSSILAAQNFSMPAGYIENEDGESVLVRVGDKLTSTDELENLMLLDLGIDGLDPIYLSDVADIELVDNSSEIYAKLNGDNGVIISFTKQSEAAAAEVSDNIAEELDELCEEYDGLAYTSLMDQGDYIYMVVDSVLGNLLWGALFAVIILFLFLRDIRPTFIIACSIPLSVIFAVVLMYFSGVTLNLISMSGLAVGIGMLVDNSVVVIENIYRLRSNGATAVQAAVSGAAQVTGAIAASTLTTVSVFLPIVFVEGITKTLFKDMALTIGYSLLASFIVAITLVPAMSKGLLKKQKKKKEGKIFPKMQNGYRRLVGISLDHKAILLALAVALLAGSAYLSLSKGFSFMPDMESNQLSVSVTMDDGTEFEDSTAVADAVTEQLQTVDEVRTVGAIVGSDVLSSVSSLTGSSGDNSVTMYVILDEDMSRTTDEVCEEILEKCADIDKCEISVDSSGMGSMMSMLTGSGIDIEVYCNDLDDLREYATAIADTINTVEGAENAWNGVDETTRQINITVDKDAATKQGLTVAQIYADIATALSTETDATELETADSTLTVEVIEAGADTIDEDALRSYVIETTDLMGNEVSVKLTDIAEITETESMTSIGRINQKRYLDVTADIADGYNTTLVTSDVIDALEELDLPDTVIYEVGGSYETIMDSVSQMGLMLLLAVIFIYLIMVAQFQSLLSPFIIMFTIPLAFTGGFLALVIAGYDVSVIAIIGFVMLSGIIVNNGIVLVDYINRLRAEGTPKRQALVEAGVTRIRPILMTALTTIFGLMVMAFSNDMGSAMMKPIALVCIGGLIYATLMTLLVVPAVYDIFNRKEVKVVDESEFEVLED